MMADSSRSEVPDLTLSNATTLVTSIDEHKPHAELASGQLPSPPTTLQGGSHLGRITSQRLGSTEGMLARVGSRRDEDRVTEEVEVENSRKLRAAGGDLEKRDGPGKGGEDEEEEWTYPDGGLRAWLVVFACFSFACSQQGYSMAWGVFQTYLHENQFSHVPLSVLSLVVGFTNFTMNGSSFVAGRLGDRYGFKKMIAIGACCTFVSLLISAFVSFSLPLMFVFQGVLLGASQGIGLPLFMSMPSQYFLRRRGLATGLSTCGAGIGGALSSLVMRGVLPVLGYRNTLLVYLGINTVVWVFAWFLLQERLPPLKVGQTSRVSRNWLPKGCFKSGVFWSLALCFCIGIFGYTTPPYYLTSYTTLMCPELDPKSLDPAVPLIVFNVMVGIGRITSGFVCDAIGPLNSLLVSFGVGGLLQLIMWPLSRSFGTIIAFAVLEGFFSSWFLTLLPVACATLFGMQGIATVVGFIVAVTSLGQLLGGTLSGVVLSSSGGAYPNVAYFSGACMLSGGVILLYARFATERRLFARA